MSCRRIVPTGALAGDRIAWIALPRQTGCIGVDTLEQLIDGLLIFQTLKPRPQRPTQRVVLFGNDGGVGVIAADYFSSIDLKVVLFETSMQDALCALRLSPGISTVNPVDCPAGAKALSQASASCIGGEIRRRRNAGVPRTRVPSARHRAWHSGFR